MSNLKPCPFCGRTDMKAYTTKAQGREYRGVVKCKCGIRFETLVEADYSDKPDHYDEEYYNYKNRETLDMCKKERDRLWNKRV